MWGVEVTYLVFLGLPKPNELNNVVAYTWSPKDYRNRSWLLNLSGDRQVNSFNEQFLRLYSRLIMLCGRSWVRKCGNDLVDNNCVCSAPGCVWLPAQHWLLLVRGLHVPEEPFPEGQCTNITQGPANERFSSNSFTYMGVFLNEMLIDGLNECITFLRSKTII